jgi:putative redox protein
MPSALVRRRKGYEHEIEIREHRLIADEPEDRGGTDTGPKPTELLAASLASCTASFKVNIKVPAKLDDDQRERTLVIAGKCPVHRALAAQDVRIEDDLELI